MNRPVRFVASMAAMGLLAGGPVAAQTAQSRAAGPMDQKTVEAVEEHAEEAEELVDSLLEWRHVTAWRDEGELDLPVPTAPATTLISIDRADVQKLAGLLDALAAQIPQPTTASQSSRGDLRAHVDKAREIAKELQPPHAEVAADAANAKGGLVTIDRTALQRLDVELDAIEMLLPRLAR